MYSNLGACFIHIWHEKHMLGCSLEVSHWNASNVHLKLCTYEKTNCMKKMSLIKDFQQHWDQFPHMSWDIRFPTMWYVRPAKAQTSTVWSEPLLVTWIFYEYWATDRRSFGVSKLKKGCTCSSRVYSCQNATLLEITWCSSYNGL